MTHRIVTADYANAVHAGAVLTLLEQYATDPMGGGVPLSQTARATLIPHLRAFPGALSVLAFDGDSPVGLVNAFTGFSTFRALPLLNIHDVFVMPAWRRSGLALEMFAHLEQVARELGCCKLTLEVLDGNEAARGLYRMLGFRPYTLDPAAGAALFLEKTLAPEVSHA